MNDEMREAFATWIEKEKGWKLENNEGDDTDNMWEGFQAAYQLQQKRVKELELKLELRQAAYDMDNRLGKENEEIQTKLDKAVSALEIAKRCIESNTPIMVFSAYHSIIDDTLNEIKGA